MRVVSRNQGPTDSDLEDEDEDDYDNDPQSWLQDDDDLRNANIVDPDIPDEVSPEELSHFIRVDESRIPNFGQFRYDR